MSSLITSAAAFQSLINLANLAVAINLIYVGIQGFRFHKRAIDKCRAFRSAIDGIDDDNERVEGSRHAKLAFERLESTGWPKVNIGVITKLFTGIIAVVGIGMFGLLTVGCLYGWFED